jgi:hypothetical protein
VHLLSSHAALRPVIPEPTTATRLPVVMPNSLCISPGRFCAAQTLAVARELHVRLLHAVPQPALRLTQPVDMLDVTLSQWLLAHVLRPPL